MTTLSDTLLSGDSKTVTLAGLAECPFCGDEACMIPVAFPNSTRFVVECMNHACHIRTPAFAGEGEAARAWGQRATRTATPASEVEGLVEPALLAAARFWWSQHMPNSTCTHVQIKGDGRVDVTWRDADESGRYTLPVDFPATTLAARQSEIERLREALMQCWLKHDEPTTVNAICEAALSIADAGTQETKT